MIENENIPKHRCQIILNCTKEWFYEDEVKFINIEEDIQGRDLLTYECPRCGELHKSLVYG